MGVVNKLSVAAALLLCSFVTAKEQDTFKPRSLSYADLVDDAKFRGARIGEVLHNELAEFGMVTVNDIPNFPALRSAVLRGAHACGGVSAAAKTHTFEDNTVRRTMATTIDGNSAAKQIVHGESELCAQFEQASDSFRKAVSEVSDAFVHRLSSIIDTDDVPLLYSIDKTKEYKTVESIVKGAEHLEHFHSYHLPEGKTQSPQTKTIDFHTDQGLFIAFTPALMVGGNKATGSHPGEFFVQLRDGSHKVVEFGFNGDVLVFMLGDGVDQYLNPKYHNGPHLRAMPHALRMPKHAAGESRVWYGRMFLAPATALSEKDGLSFGRVRELLQKQAQDANHEEANLLTMGCARPAKFAIQEAVCAENQIYCWHRCMNHTAEVSTSACAAKGLQLKCVDQWGRLPDPDTHGDYWPGCTNTTMNATRDSPIPVPANATCPEWSTFASTSGFNNTITLVPNRTILMWNVVGSDIHATIVHNARVGWIGFGLENAGGGNNGMNGANVVIGMWNHTSGGSVREYKIAEDRNAFRWWGAPYTSNLASEAMTVNDCYAKLTFKTKKIGSQTLSLGSNVTYIWALSEQSYAQDNYLPYHSGILPSFPDRVQYRGKRVINLMDSSLLGHENDDDTPDEHEGHDHSVITGGAARPAPASALVVAAVAVLAAIRA